VEKAILHGSGVELKECLFSKMRLQPAIALRAFLW
jgi:hypothetical protein